MSKIIEPSLDEVERLRGEARAASDLGEHVLAAELYNEARLRDLRREFPRRAADDIEMEAILMWRADATGDVCCARDASGFSICTRLRGHEGDHVAAGTRFVTARWPQ